MSTPERHAHDIDESSGDATSAARKPWAVVACIAVCGVLVATVAITRVGPDSTAPTSSTTTNEPAFTEVSVAQPTADSAPTTAAPTTAEAAPPVSVVPPAAVPDRPPYGDRWDGSGCAPGPGPLPDGWWAGRIGLHGGISNAATAAGLDLMCVKRHPVAEDGYFWTEVENSSPTEREIPLAPSGPTSWCLRGGEDYMLSFDVDGLGTHPCYEVAAAEVYDPDTVWVKVIDGHVHEIVQQFGGLDRSTGDDGPP